MYIVSGLNRLIFILYREKSAAPLTFVYMGYELGSILAPLLVAPYLDKRFSGIHATMKIGHNSFADMISRTESYNATNITEHCTNHSYPVAVYPANFVTAFWIIAILGIIITLACVIFLIHGYKSKIKVHRYQTIAPEQTFLQSLSLRNYSQSHPYHALAMLILFFFYMACIMSMARIYSKIIFSYVRDGPGMSVASASLINSSFFISCTVGMLLVMLPMMVLHIKYILQVSYQCR